MMINSDDSTQQRLDALRQDLIEKGREEYPALSDEILKQVIDFNVNALKEGLEREPQLTQEFIKIKIDRWDDQIVDPVYDRIQNVIKNVPLLPQEQLDDIEQRRFALNRNRIEAYCPDSDSDGSWDLEPVSIKKRNT
ncbi:MAG: hypothetical protein ACH350_08400 [Parachlamydiaceae bacterium]